MTTILSTKGQVVIPSKLRERKGWHPGDELEVRETADSIIIRKKRRNHGLVRHLQACPVKGFPVPEIEGGLHPAKFDVSGGR